MSGGMRGAVSQPDFVRGEGVAPPSSRGRNVARSRFGFSRRRSACDDGSLASADAEASGCRASRPRWARGLNPACSCAARSGALSTSCGWARSSRSRRFMVLLQCPVGHSSRFRSFEQHDARAAATQGRRDRQVCDADTDDDDVGVGLRHRPAGRRRDRASGSTHRVNDPCASDGVRALPWRRCAPPSSRRWHEAGARLIWRSRRVRPVPP